jgi:hypothetical protein
VHGTGEGVGVACDLGVKRFQKLKDEREGTARRREEGEGGRNSGWGVGRRSGRGMGGAEGGGDSEGGRTGGRA